jgi:hypothetical protein
LHRQFSENLSTRGGPMTPVTGSGVNDIRI